MPGHLPTLFINGDFVLVKFVLRVGSLFTTDAFGPRRSDITDVVVSERKKKIGFWYCEKQERNNIQRNVDKARRFFF